MLHQYITNFPMWALNYVVNNDRDCLDDDDVEQIDNYLQEWSDALGAKWLEIVAECDTRFFSYAPAFGMPCEVCSVDLIYQN